MHLGISLRNDYLGMCKFMEIDAAEIWKPGSIYAIPYGIYYLRIKNI